MTEKVALSIHGKPVDTTPDSFGELRSSADAVDDFDTLRARFEAEGYVYLPRLLDVDTLAAARLTMLEALADLDFIDTDYPLGDGVAKRECNVSAREMVGLSKNNDALRQALFAGPMIAFYEEFLGGPVRPLDFTWCRVKSSGTETATNPHYDIVFMGRGTQNLYTSWTPLGDTPREMGGLMILEDSHRLEEIKATYGQSDVDVYCINEMELDERGPGKERWQGSGTGTFASDAIALREELNGRWLTTDYELGDLLVFSMYTMHASMDNLKNRLRLSTDTRYQLASEPVDERWIGENPIAHGPEAKKGIIC